MTRKLRKKQTEDASTDPRDWVGAAKVLPGERPRLTGSPMTFYLHAASNDSTLFVALPRDDKALLPPRPKNGQWRFFKSFQETGHARVGFDEAAAKKDIKTKGHHLVRVIFDTSEIVPRKTA